MDSQGSFYGDGQGIAERASPSSRPQSQWLTPLQSVSASHSPYASPTSASPSLSEAPFPGFFHQQSTGQQSLSTPQPSLPRSSSSVSLNLSSLSVSSPTSHPSTAGSVSSPITPLTPSANATPQAHSFTSGQPLSLPSLAPQHQPPSFRFNLPDPSSSSSPFDYPLSRDPASSRSSTSSDKSIPRKRSLQTVTPLSTNIEESVNMSNNGLFEQTLHGPHTGHSHHSQRPSTTIEIPGTGYGDDGDLSSYGNGDPMGSPMDDSPSSPHFPDESKTSLSNIGPTPSGIPINATKPSTGANNFVNKLYMCVASRHFPLFFSSLSQFSFFFLA
ncbi:hypothetical protein SISSUDRAFT_241032 [Sistotremastrum suecicum HHB10207 ss-3]|uniref:Uncharacterized protein n=1 Tax=Sistotremastrum suecicum HHB10207 ss-3 TaxID=1314776 RepID=A0A166GJW3_9AGAM|nr:hypothetical protein SISSUDRAFT_241032 [Sistotremastrum suecicum HHB10207 ss-3]